MTTENKKDLEKLIKPSMCDKDYFAYNSISQSKLKNFSVSYDYMKYREVTPMTGKNLDFGTAFHTALLEPEKLHDSVKIEPTFNKRTNQGKLDYQNFLAECEGKLILSNSELMTIHKMIDKVKDHPKFGDIFKETKYKQSERAIFGKISNLNFKGKIDYIDWENRIIIDVKTTSKRTWSEIAKDFGNYQYYMQHVIYGLLTEQEYFKEIGTRETFDFYFLFVSTVEPHHVYIYKMCIKNIVMAFEIVSDLIVRYKNHIAHTETKYGGEYDFIIDNFILPDYHFKKYLEEK